MGVSKIPILDWSSSSTLENLKPGSSSWISASKSIRQALEEYSCFEVVFNKPSEEFVKEIYSASKELFDLPIEIKKKNVSPRFSLGYLPMTTDNPEGFGIEAPTDIESCTRYTNLIWPEGNDHFCKTVHSYAVMVSEVEKLVGRMLCDSYGLDEKYYEEHVKAKKYHQRLLKYLKSPFKGHMDKTFLTFVHNYMTDDLEISTKSGEWIPYVPSSPSSFLVLAGDLCMAWSNDRIKSLYHRVSPKAERYSLALFTFLEGVIEAPSELVDEEHPRQYKPFDIGGLHDFYVANIGDPTIREWNIIKAYCDVLK